MFVQSEITWILGFISRKFHESFTVICGKRISKLRNAEANATVPAKLSKHFLSQYAACDSKNYQVSPDGDASMPPQEHYRFRNNGTQGQPDCSKIQQPNTNSTITRFYAILYAILYNT